MTNPMLRVSMLIVVVLVVAGCSSKAEREARALKRGGEYFAAENWDKARVEYRNALQLVPNDGEARYRNGLVVEKLGQLREAAQFYIGALEVNPELSDARTHLAGIYVIGGVPESAIEVLKPGLEKSPDNAGMLGMRAAARARLHESDLALKDAEAAAARDPRDENVIAVLAGLYTSAQQASKAEALLAQGVHDLPKSVDLRLALAQLELTLERPERTESLLREVVALRPLEAGSRIRLARFLATHAKTDAAQQVLQEARVALPKDLTVRAALIEFLAANRGREVAEAELRRMAAAEPDQVDVKFALAGFYVQGNDPQRAEAVLQDVIKNEGTNASGLTARTRLAAIRITRNDAAGAEKLVGDVLEKSPHDADALVLRGNLRLARGDAKGAIDDLRAASRDLPNSQPILRALARAHLRNNEIALAEEMLRRAVDADPSDTPTRMELVELLQQTGQKDEARSALRALAKERPGDIVVQTAAMHSALETHDLPYARTVLEAVRGLKGEATRASLFAGFVAEADGHAEEALKNYRDTLARDPAEREALIQATHLLLGLKRTGEAMKLLDEVASRAPEYALPASLKGDALLAERDFSGADKAYQGALSRAPRWWLPYRGQAYVLVGRGDVNAAVRLLTDAAGKVDEPWRLHADAGQLLDLSGRREEAIASYEKAFAGAGAGSAVANNLAMLLVDVRKDPASAKRAASMVEPFANASNPQIIDTYGWVRYRNGDLPGALAALERAARVEPVAPVIRYHLGVIQDANGQRDKAIANLQLAVSSKQNFPGGADAVAALARLTPYR